jgi:catechol 2,3-dioxygenase-like lactoylglutathione lyase family enzyme
MRLQLALNVSDLDQAITFYSRLFGTQPHKRRPGYANFVIEQPPLKLVLFERPGATERLNHLGVEVLDGPELDGAIARLAASGLRAGERSTGVCCHAEQDKVWVEGPDGEPWEWYRVTDDAPETRTSAGCC